MKTLTTIVFAMSVLMTSTTGKPFEQTDDAKSKVLQPPADRTSEDFVPLTTVPVSSLEVTSSKEKSSPPQKKTMFEPMTTESQPIAYETEQIDAKLSHKESFRNDNSNPETDINKDTDVISSNSDDSFKNGNPKLGFVSSEESSRAEVSKTKLDDSSTTKPSVYSLLVNKILDHVTSETASEDITKKSNSAISTDAPQQKELDEISSERETLKLFPKSSPAETRDTQSSSSEKILDKLLETSSSETEDQDKDHDDSDHEKKILIRKILHLTRRDNNDDNESIDDDNEDSEDSHEVELQDDEENDEEDINATDVTVNPVRTVLPSLSDLTRQRLAGLSRSKLQEALSMLRRMRNGTTWSTVPTTRSTSKTERTTRASRSRDLLKISMGEICCSFG